jgi:hypothetical protein
MYGSCAEVGREEVVRGIVNRLRVVRTEVIEKNMTKCLVFDRANTELRDWGNIWAMARDDLVSRPPPFHVSGRGKPF